MVKLLIAPVVDLIKDYFSRKSEEKKAIHEAKIKRIELDGDWETIQAQASTTSFKDEWWVIVLSLPIIAICWAIFIDDLTIIDRVREGFEVLETLPEWYQYLLYVAVLSSFGIRGADKLMSMRSSK